MKYRVVVNSQQGKLTYHINDYDIIDEGHTFRFHDSKKQKTKRFPYRLVEVDEVENSE